MSTPLHVELVARSIPIELLEARDRGELIICVGPELGRSAGLPTAAELATVLLAEAEASELELDFAALRQWIAAGRISESLEVLQRQLGPRFTRIVEGVLADRGRPVPRLARAIAALGDQLRAVYTTGIDRVLERAFADEWPSFASPRSDMARRTKLIFKLCGTLEFPESWVLTCAELDAEFGRRSLRRQVLAAAYQAHCLLFIGFDPKDELATRLFSLIDIGGEAQLPSHFLVVERCGLEQRTLLERRGLHVLASDPVALLEEIGTNSSSGEARDATATDELPACPYPGLVAFNDSLARVFHGRRAEISQAAARLGGPKSRHRRWLAIDGSSGVGKSSFVHAGLIPALRRGFAEATPTRWKLAKLRPGRQPFRALADALTHALLPTRAEPRISDQALASDALVTAASVAQFVQARTPARAGVLVVVDQLEEVVTLASAHEGAQFGACLTLLLERELIYLVTTLRSDFIAVLSSALPPLARLLNEQAERYTLAPISRVSLRAAISEPATQLGVSFEGDLIERIATDAEQHLRHPSKDQGVVVRTDDAALPLVAHVLRALWDARAHEDQVITFAEYQALGGVSGALSRNADALLADLDSKQRARVRALLLRMVHLDDGRLVGRTLPRAEALEFVGGGAEGERLLGLLCGSAGPRLLVARSSGDELLVDLVHEALLREWDSLRGWIAADQAQLARDEALGRRAAAWVAQGRARRSLPRGPERRELLRGRPHGREAPSQRQYQRAMKRAAWLRGGAWIGFGALAIALSLVTVQELRNQRAQTEQREAELDTTRSKLNAEALNKQQRQRREQIEQLLRAGRCHQALREALSPACDDDSATMRELLRRAVSCEAVVGVVARSKGDGRGVTALSFVPKGHELWAGRSDGSVDRWNLRNHELHALGGLSKAVDDIRFGPDGEQVALSSGGDGRTLVTDREGHPTGVSIQGVKPSFASNGRLIALRQTNTRVGVHDPASGEQLWSEITARKAKGLAFMPGDDKVAYAISKRSGSEILIHSMGSPAIVGRLSVPGLVRDFAVSPDGKYVATTADDTYTRLWDLSTSNEAVVPAIKLDLADTPKLKFVQFSPTGSMLATLRAPQSVLITDMDLKPLCEVDGVDSDSPTLFSPDGRWLLTAGLDQTLRLWDPKVCHLVSRLELDGELSALSFTPQSDGIVGGFSDGSLVHWAIDAREWWRDPAPHHQGVKALSFSPVDPRQLASGSSTGSVHLWSIGAAKDPPEDWQHSGWVMALAFTDDGSQVTAYSDQGALHRWPLGAGLESEAGATACASRTATMAPSAQLLAIGCPQDKTLVVWDVAHQRSSFEFPLAGAARLVAISDDGSKVAIGSESGGIELWQLTGDGAVTQPLRLPASQERVTSLAFDRRGDALVSGGSDASVVVWAVGDLEHPQVLHKLYTRGMGGRRVESVAISAGGDLVAAGAKNDGVIELWDASGTAIGHIDMSCGDYAVSVLRFSADEQILAAGCSDGNVRMWPVGEAAQIEFGCERLARTHGDDPLPERCVRTHD